MGYVVPALLPMLALVAFHTARSLPLLREQRYSTCLVAAASAAVIGLSFFSFMVFCWIMY